MTDEAALKLAESMDRLSAAIEAVSNKGLTQGINVWHHNSYPLQPQPYYSPQTYPHYPLGGYGQSNTGGAQ